MRREKFKSLQMRFDLELMLWFWQADCWKKDLKFLLMIIENGLWHLCVWFLLYRISTDSTQASSEFSSPTLNQTSPWIVAFDDPLELSNNLNINWRLYHDGFWTFLRAMQLLSFSIDFPLACQSKVCCRLKYSENFEKT